MLEVQQELGGDGKEQHDQRCRYFFQKANLRFSPKHHDGKTDQAHRGGAYV